MEGEKDQVLPSPVPMLPSLLTASEPCTRPCRGTQHCDLCTQGPRASGKGKDREHWYR